MKKILLILIAVILFSFEAKPQNAIIDSLQQVLKTAKEDTSKANTLYELSKQLIGTGDYDRAAVAANVSLSLSEKLNFKRGMAVSYNCLGVINQSKGTITEALKNFASALVLFEEIGDNGGVAKTYNNIGVAYKNQGNLTESLKTHFASLKIREKIEDKAGIAASYNNIGIIYDLQRNYATALKYYSASLKIKEELGNSRGVASAYLNIGVVYVEQGKYTDALKNYFSSLKISNALGDRSSIASCYINIGNVYRHYALLEENLDNAVYLKQLHTDAIKNYLKALKILEEIGDKNGISGCYIVMGSAYASLKKYTEARKYLRKGLMLSKEVGSKEQILTVYNNLSKMDSSTGNYQEAYMHHKLYILYRDSLINEESTKKTIQLQMQYDFDKKESATRAAQDKKDAVAAATFQKQGIVKNSFIGGFAIVLVFAGVFFTQRNRISKEKKRSDVLLLNILPAETAEELKRTGAAESKDFNEVTVLFTDFKNFTALSERLNAKELVSEINYCYSAFDSIITKYGIEKIKTIGDSYMCAGGLPVANKTNADDAVKAALEIRDFMLNERNKREIEDRIFFEIRIGLHTGPVVAGIVGIKKFAYDIWGDTVNIASRMESNSEPGKVNISGATHELVKDKFTCTHRGKIEAKNKGMIDMYFVEG